jgi:hypothetical protein
MYCIFPHALHVRYPRRADDPLWAASACKHDEVYVGTGVLTSPDAIYRPSWDRSYGFADEQLMSKRGWTNAASCGHPRPSWTTGRKEGHGTLGPGPSP